MKRIIITGATGYIGSHETKYLLSQGFSVAIVVRAHSNLASVEGFLDRIQVITYVDIQHLIPSFKSFRPDTVLHLAACVNTHYKPEDVPSLIQSNIEFGVEILEAMKQCGCKNLINTGTYWQNYKTADYDPVDLYAATKEAFEKLIFYYVKVEEIKAITLRLFDVYGADDKRPKLWNILSEHDTKDNPILLSPGGQMLDMVYIDDVCSAYLAAINEIKKMHSCEYRIYGVFTGKRYSLKSIVNLYRQLINKDIFVVFGGKSYKKREVVDPVIYPRIPNWQPKITLIEGLNKVIEALT